MLRIKIFFMIILFLNSPVCISVSNDIDSNENADGQRAQDSTIKNIFTSPSSINIPSRKSLSLTLNCSRELPDAYISDLLIESKYAQSDKTKSTLRKTTDRVAKTKNEQIEKFTKSLVTFADYALLSENDATANMALLCFDQLLQSWSSSDAMLSSQTSKTGMAVRKWLLASVSTASLKVLSASDGRYELTAAQIKWISQLAWKVMHDYNSRLVTNSPHFNNHDYWAGWAVVAASMITQENKLYEWGMRVLDKAITQIEISDELGFGFFPNEIARGRLATNYMQYSMVPLIYLAESARVNNDLRSGYLDKIDSLVTFALLAETDSKKLHSVLAVGSQRKVPERKYVWLYPYLKLNPKNNDALKLYEFLNGDIDGYTQAGGSVKLFFLTD